MKSRLFLSALALVLAAAPAQAQSQTFHACYVPDVGAMYLIQLPGLPTQCLSSGHEEISWTESASGELADGSVTTAKLADAAVTTAKLGPGSVTAEKIAAGSVGTSQLADGGVTAAKLGSDVSLGADPADGSITTVKLADGAVTATKLGAGSVTSDKIAAGAVGSAQLADGSVGTTEIQDGAVTAAKIGSDVPLPPTNCSADQIIRWNGSAWVCTDEGGVSSVEIVTTVYTLTKTGNVLFGTFTSDCPAGKKVIGGGYKVRQDIYGTGFEDPTPWNPDLNVHGSRPITDSSWGMLLWYDFPQNATVYEVTVDAICATMN